MGHRNFLVEGVSATGKTLDVLDAVFVLSIDRATLERRLEQRPEGERGAEPSERDLVRGLHHAGGGTPAGIVVDATAPLERVVDQILALAAGEPGQRAAPVVPPAATGEDRAG